MLQDRATKRPMIKRLLACLGIVALATPALYAEFYIIQNPTTMRCRIADLPPAPGAGNFVIVGDGAYGDPASAEYDMARMAACMGTGG